jgi:uncharacterized membrane protein YozB (DUF420 family)
MSQDIRTRDRQFVAWVAGLTVAVVLVGFSRSFFLRPFFATAPDWAAKESIFYAHGTVFALWFGLLAVQVGLVRTRHVKLHRRLGYAGAVLAALLVAAGTLAALRAANRPGGFIGVPVPSDQFLLLPLAGVVLFGILVALAVLWRRDTARHKRLMLLASINLIGAAIARIPMMTGLALPGLDVAVFLGLIGLMLVWDWVTERRLRPDTLIGGAAVSIANVAAVPLGGTAAWLAIAHPLMALVPPP